MRAQNWMHWGGGGSRRCAAAAACCCYCLQTLLPLTPTGELCDLEGNCVDAAEDEIFKLTTQVREGRGAGGAGVFFFGGAYGCVSIRRQGWPAQCVVPWRAGCEAHN